MKGRTAYLLTAVSAFFLLSACNAKKKIQMPPAPAVSQAQSEEITRIPNDDTIAFQKEPLPLPKKDSSEIDVDLTKMNSNMIYSYIFEMIVDPDSYMGKTIKVEGFFNSFLDESNGERYFAVIIPDALACCKQGMEFKWEGKHNYPQDYPEENQKITVTGKYCSEIMEGDISYYYLQVSSLTM